MLYTFELVKRHKCWAKVVDKVNMNMTNGYAFDGNFVKTNQLVEIPDECFVLTYEEIGSNKHKKPYVKLYQAKDNEIIQHGEKIIGMDWALQLRDFAAKLINIDKDEKNNLNPLEEFTTEDLIVELKNRGIEVKEIKQL